MRGDEDKPARQQLTPVTLMHCQPGRAYDPDTGPPLAMISLARKGELLPTLAMSLRDSARLVEGLCRALAAFGDDDATEVVDKYFGGSDGTGLNRGFGTSVLSSPSPPTKASSPPLKRGKRKSPSIKPSRSSTSPKDPITQHETWLMHRLLANVATHADFLRFIGADQLSITDIPPLSPTETPACQPKADRSRKVPKPKEKRRNNPKKG